MILTLLLGLGGPLGWGLLGACAKASGSRLSDPHSPRPPAVWRAEAEDIGGDPVRRNWCPYQKSRLVTFVAACKTEKFLVHSQQPCPQETPDCQKVKVMYRMIHKPVYKVKQKVLASVAWKCCPGFSGPDCRHYDPTAILEPEDPGDGLQESWDGPVSFEPGHLAAEISDTMVPQEDLQNDIHQVADSLPGLWKALESNVTAATMEANQTEPVFPGRSLEQVLLPHMDAFLRVHFSPIWSSFNQSLHSLSQVVRNLSLEVEANQQAIRGVQESTVARADFQELGAKFETKVQDNAQRVGQLRQDVEERMHAQHLSLQQSVSEVHADVDAKLKRFLKAQGPVGANGSLVPAAAGAAARPEPESLQARLGQLQRNLSALHAAAGRREEELRGILADMQATLAQHVEEIKELYSESDETFDQISQVEHKLLELQVNHTALRELRVILMEKSLIMEENKEEMERQLLELNLTIQHLHGTNADLIKYVKDCDCQKLYLDLNATRALEEAQVGPDERRRLEGSSLQALSDAVAALSRAVDERRAEGERARADGARLRSQLRALDGEAAAEAAGGRDASPGEAGGRVPAGLAQELERLDADLQRVGRCCEAPGVSSLNSSLEGLQEALSATERDLEQHQRLFHSLFGNFQGLLAVNVSLDLGKLQAMLSKKGKKRQKGLEASRRRDRKEAEPRADAHIKGPVLWEAGSPVAFYASFSEGTTALQTVKFNTTYVNIGSSYFPEHGYFRAPERGVYLFAVSIEFGPGPGTGQLVFGGHHQTPVGSTEERKGGSTATTFAMAELQKGERVWFELTQGSVVKRHPPGTTFGGFLMFKT
ncbi:multimerin-2 [Herpailurus yagouaroundi]|uniref:multimerin-2 n=1 Tax=Herpailurus yagouaroundi TaxID=1608482 RepID=UPI001AD75029|nr:multimerin-2 [Puma yagouaroundi]